ncbi:tropomodulin isoform X2 [Neocloeon triangulifer]|uniref:tropomodulin isoform X2 n=1 Tax=Neocloeon triangulifer TaxID=2078957 RepID=UPI00286EF767|nr:tropomodulin isoform X2 [Neocloeon triangulifer]
MVDVEEDGFESEIRRKVTRKTFTIEEKSSTTKTMTSSSKAALQRMDTKEMAEYNEMDMDELLAQLSSEEINMLSREVDPDDNTMPPSLRCGYFCEKEPTGPLDRHKLIDHINKQALETPDKPEAQPFVAGTVRGKKWVAPKCEKTAELEEQIGIDLGDEYETALSGASQEEIIDLAAILGFHSMMNQDQYHASLLNKGQPVGMGWDGVTKASQPKAFPNEPPNLTNPDETIKRVKEDDHTLKDVNWNNIKNISDEKFTQLFEALASNTHLESLSLTNTGLMDRTALLLADALEKNSTLRVLNVETNFISPAVMVTLLKALLATKSVEEFRGTNQRSQVLGNKIEMQITEIVEQNFSLLRLGLHLEYNDARHRVAAHLQRNLDRNRLRRTGRLSRNLLIGYLTSKKSFEN